MLSDSKEYPPSSLLPTNESSGSAVKCWDANILTHTSIFIQVFSIFKRTCAHTLFLHVCMDTEGVGLPSTEFRSSRESLQEFVLIPVFPVTMNFALIYHLCCVFNALFGPACTILHIYTQLQVILEESAAGSSGLHLVKNGFKNIRAQKALFLCTKNSTARAPRIAECCLVSRGR